MSPTEPHSVPARVLEEYAHLWGKLSNRQIAKAQVDLDALAPSDRTYHQERIAWATLAQGVRLETALVRLARAVEGLSEQESHDESRRAPVRPVLVSHPRTAREPAGAAPAAASEVEPDDETEELDDEEDEDEAEEDEEEAEEDA